VLRFRHQLWPLLEVKVSYAAPSIPLLPQVRVTAVISFDDALAGAHVRG
jgi:hypothetical protein